MKILIVSSLYNVTPPNGYGGTERFVYYFTKELMKRGYDVKTVVKPGSVSDISESYVYSTYDNLKTDFEICFNKMHPDLVILNTKDNGIIELIKQTKTPTIVILHNNVRHSSSWLDIINNSPEFIYFAFISNNQLEKTKKNLLIKYPNYKLIHNLVNLDFGMDVESYTIKYSKVLKPYHLYIGTIARYKGVLDIVKEFSKNGDSLLVVGPCTSDVEKNYYEEVLNVIKTSPNITYIAETKNEDEKINIILKAKSLIIATGYDPLENDCDEAFGLVMLEANSLGVPIIGYAKGNMLDYIREGINGYKFTDISQISNLIHKVQLSDMSENCIEVAKRYDIKGVCEKYDKFIRQLLRIEL